MSAAVARLVSRIVRVHVCCLVTVLAVNAGN